MTDSFSARSLKTLKHLYHSVVKLDLFGYKTYIAAGVAALLWGIVHLPIAESLFGGYFVAALLYRLSSRLQFGFALVFLVLAAAARQVSDADHVSLYASCAYYFLVIGLVIAVSELIRDNKAEKTLA